MQVLAARVHPLPCPLRVVLPQKKLDDGEYDNIMDFVKDVNLIWSNCTLYNQVRTVGVPICALAPLPSPLALRVFAG